MNENLKNNDQNTAVSFFRKEVNKFVEERNWSKYHTPKDLVQAINCEAGELSQLLLFKDYTKGEIWKNKTLLRHISEEIADVFIYLISLINALDLDLSQIFIDKMEKNKIKYSSKEFNNGIYYKKSNQENKK
ncbi:MAG: nucleotide pyrophosphohydrolase [Promethearchaeota archaeon]